MAPESSRGDSGGHVELSPRGAVDQALARVAFRALGSRDAEKLRDMCSKLSAADVRHSVRAAADIFVHTVLCAVNGTVPDAPEPGVASQLKLGESKPTPDVSEGVAPTRRSRRRLSVSRRKSEPVRREHGAVPGNDLQTVCQEMSRLSTAFAELTTAHRTAVAAVCNDVLRSASPLLVDIHAQYSKGISQAVDATRKTSLRVNRVLGAKGYGVRRRGDKGDTDVAVLTERVAIAASEAMFQSGRAVEMLKVRLSVGGFKAVLASSRLDTRYLLPRKRENGPGARVASLLNIIDGRAAELSSITSQFSDDVDAALSAAQGFKSAGSLRF